MPRLKIKSQGLGIGDIELKPGVNKLGRNGENHFVVNDSTVSGFHCEVQVYDGPVVIKDLNSANGTFIDGQPVRISNINTGQTLQLGGVQFTYEEAAVAVEAPAAPKLGISRSVHAPVIADSAAVPPVQPALTLPPAIPKTGLGVASRPPEAMADEASPVVDFTGPSCRNHPQTRAQYICTQCHNRLCAQCADVRPGKSKVRAYCLVCKGACIPVEEYERQEKERVARENRTFIQELPGILKYPFGHGGTFMLVLGTLTFLVLDFVARFSWWMTIFAGGYLFVYLQSIITTTARGEDRLPDWPEFAEWWSDVAVPFFTLVFTVLVCFGPALAYLVMAGNSKEDVNYLIAFPLIGLGLLYFPMALLATAMSDSFIAINPFVVIPAITKVPVEYIIACVVFFLMVVLRYLSETLLKTIIPIPILPSIPTGFLTLYFLTVEMRLLGVLYYKNRVRIGWYSM